MKHALHLFLLSFMWICSNSPCGWSKAPDPPKIVFTSTRDGNREIYVMNPDGSEQNRLTHNPASDLFPVWSPTGEQILFTSNRSGERDLYLMDMNGENVKRIFENRKSAHREHPTWSPDGKQIAYKRIELGMRFIYIATIEGKNEEQVAMGRYPDWSPQGTQIAFANGGFGGSQIALLDINTWVEELLIPNDKKMPWMSRPAWSDVGDRVAFVWNKNPLPNPPDPWPPRGWRVPEAWLDKETIYIAHRDGTGLERIVEEVGPPAVSPVWLSNDKELIYTQEIDGHLQIFKIDIESRIPIQLTDVVGFGGFQANTGGDWFDPAFALPVSPQSRLLSTSWGQLKTE